MSLDFSDIAEERAIDRYGYECQRCEERSFDVRKRRDIPDMPLLCDTCASISEAEEVEKAEKERELSGVVDEAYAFGIIVMGEKYA